MSTPRHKVKRSRSPLAIAAFIAIPLFFSSLMASTLALEKPRVVQWTSGGKLLTTWHEPAASTTLRVWLWAFVPPLVLIIVGAIAIRLPHGFYVSCVSAIVIAFAVLHRLDRWTLHHTLRFPMGVDLIPASNATSNRYDPGEWERMARATAISLGHWTMGIAIAAMIVVATAAARRRYFNRGMAGVTYVPMEGVHGTDATMPGLGPQETADFDR
ncbi:MAG TPA: hypothetical protein VMB53_12260 [Gaiellaceae bacterium]|nr:hypothetical protein [Gaiellaceae bacterium]